MNFIGKISFSAGRVFLLTAVLLCMCVAGRAGNGNDRFAMEVTAVIEQADRYFENIHQDMSGLQKAICLYTQVLDQYPDHQEARWKLAEVLFISAMEAGEKSSEKRYYEQSLHHAEKALSSDPACVPALFYCGCARASLADLSGTFRALSLLKKGKKELTNAMEFAPADRFGIVAAAVLSQVHADTPWPMRDLKEAERLARQAVTWDPNLTMASVQLATVYRRKGDYNAARTEARRCLDIVKPTYMSDAVLWDWPAARKVLEKIRDKTGE